MLPLDKILFAMQADPYVAGIPLKSLGALMLTVVNMARLEVGEITMTTEEAARAWRMTDLKETELIITAIDVHLDKCRIVISNANIELVGEDNFIVHGISLQVPDFLNTLTRRNAGRLRVTKHREKAGVTPSVTDNVTDVESTPEARLKRMLSESPETMRQAVRICTALAVSILEWQPDYKDLQAPVKLATVWRWAVDVEKAIRIDARTPEAMLDVVRWLPSHQGGGDFRWREQIRSGAKLREKFDQLLIAYRRVYPNWTPERAGGSGNGQGLDGAPQPTVHRPAFAAGRGGQSGPRKPTLDELHGGG